MSHRKLPQIGIDLMGSDTSPEILLKATLDVAKELKESVHITVFGTPDYLPKTFLEEITFIAVNEVITMQDDPLAAVRRKKDSSLCKGMRMLQAKELDAFISSGNTGALIASAKLFLPMLLGIDRPALMTLLPTQKQPLAVLDVGANVTCKPSHLVQFAAMGVAYQKSRGIAHPRIGLLNNGIEEHKGTSELKEAYQALKTFDSFVGNIEGRTVFEGDIDVLITDGFTGNIFLKTAEGVGTYLLHLLNQTNPMLAKNLYSHLSYAEYPGALLAGVEGIAMKCHGNASPQALAQSVKAALNLITHHFISQIKSEL